jgi:sugar phosphate isomerase/epimerase
MNIIEQKLQEFDDILPKITPHHEEEQKYAEMLTDVMNHPYKSFLRQAMLEAMETVLKEAEIEGATIEEVWHGHMGENVVKDDIRNIQKQRHQQILSNYKTPKGNN